MASKAKEKISVGAERQRRYRAVKKLRKEPTEKHLWDVVLLYSGVKFKTYSGVPFSHEVRKGRNGEFTKELWIDRREKSKSLAYRFREQFLYDEGERLESRKPELYRHKSPHSRYNDLFYKVRP